MKYIHFNDMDGSYIYRADEISAIQLPHTDPPTIYIQMGKEVVNNYNYASFESAMATYTEICKQLCG